MAVSTNGHPAAVSKAEDLLMEAAVGPCVEAIQSCQTNVSACIVATDLCNAGLLIPYQLTGLNPCVSVVCSFFFWFPRRLKRECKECREEEEERETVTTEARPSRE